MKPSNGCVGVGHLGIGGALSKSIASRGFLGAASVVGLVLRMNLAHPGHKSKGKARVGSRLSIKRAFSP
jgi:hypothetical protein